MPHTEAWRDLFDAAHDCSDMSDEWRHVGDATMNEWAEQLGLTLDRRTLESALWTISLVIGIAWMFEASEHGPAAVLADDDATPSEENRCLALAAARYLVVKRLDEMIG